MKYHYSTLTITLLLGVSLLLLNQPARAQVRVYAGPNYTGASDALGLSTYNRLGVGITSIEVANGYEVQVYDQPNLRGNSLRLRSSVPRLVVWDNRIRSARVNRVGPSIQPPRPVGPVPIQPPRPVGPSPVTPPTGTRPVAYLYENERYGGRMIALMPGRYRADELQGLSRQLSSLQVSAGYTVQLYDKNGFRGAVHTVQGQITQLAPMGWDNRAVSLAIVRQ